jgi:hypothetical protein
LLSFFEDRFKMGLTGAAAAKASREVENRAHLTHHEQMNGLFVLYAPGTLFALRCICCHHDTRYAVDIQSGRFTRWKPDSLAAAWYCFIVFTNIWLFEPNVRENDLVSSALPEAKIPFG